MLSVPRAPDPHRLLLRALLKAFPDAALIESRATPWASATFVGARHHVALLLDDAAAAHAAQEMLPMMEFALRRTLVADIAARASDARLDIEALTIEDH